jgi:hypothetical protein
MTNFSDLFIGDTVRFTYNAGSNPGSERRVKLDIVDNAFGRLAGEDLSLPMGFEGKYPYRQFKYDYIDERTLVIEPKEVAEVASAPLKGERISFVDVQGEITDCLNDLSPEKLAELHKELTGSEADMRFDDATGDFVVPEKPATTQLVTMDSDECVFHVTNKNGKTVEYAIESIYDGNGMRFYGPFDESFTIEEFAKNLAKHLDI